MQNTFANQIECCLYLEEITIDRHYELQRDIKMH